MSCTSCVYRGSDRMTTYHHPVIGECRRFPPRFPRGKEPSSFPLVTFEMACGEFKGRLVEQDTVTVYKSTSVGRTEMPGPKCPGCDGRGFQGVRGTVQRVPYTDAKYEVGPIRYVRCTWSCEPSLHITAGDLAELTLSPPSKPPRMVSCTRCGDKGYHWREGRGPGGYIGPDNYVRCTRGCEASEGVPEGELADLTQPPPPDDCPVTVAFPGRLYRVPSAGEPS